MADSKWRERLKFYRKKRGKTQADIALHMNISQQTVGNWEKPGGTNPNVEELFLLTNFLDISIDDLFSDVHLNRKEVDKKNGDNVNLNVNPHVHLKPENYQENDKTSLVNNSGGQNAKSPVGDQAKYIELLEKHNQLLEKYNQVLEGRLIEHDFSYKFQDISARLKALQALVLEENLLDLPLPGQKQAVFRKKQQEALLQSGIRSGDST